MEVSLAQYKFLKIWTSRSSRDSTGSIRLPRLRKITLNCNLSGLNEPFNESVEKHHFQAKSIASFLSNKAIKNLIMNVGALSLLSYRYD